MEDDLFEFFCRWDGVLQFFYDSEENIFYDQCGQIVTNIFEVLTPNDIFLFKQDPGYNVFPHRDNNRILCEILTDYE